MNTNSNTVIKLSEALNNLIKAYEELQEKNNEIKEKNDSLEKELFKMKSEKDNLTNNVEELNENTQKQESNINSMLGKIESLLGVKPKKELKDIIIKEENEPKEEEKEKFNLNNDIFNTQNSSLHKEEPLEAKKDDDSLDLNRMATLLNGFNK